MTITPEIRAQRSAEEMYSGDEATRYLGASLDEVTPGSAVMTMTVKPHHLNGHGICHGGFLFTFADSCFAFACNSYNQKFVSLHGEITYMAPSFGGDVLTAVATEVSKQGRSGVYDIRVTNQNGDDIVLFRGLCRSINGTHFEE